MSELTRSRRWAQRARLFGFLYLSALLMVMASERVYWYWGGVTVESVLILAAFYSLPAAAGLWALSLTRSTKLHQVVLAGAIFGFVVEGVITTVVYADGALPVFAAMFVGWHGMVAFVGFWYLTRKWLLAGRTKLIAATATVTGLAWGAWARAAATGETLDPEEAAALAADGIDTSILTAGEFAVYAALVGAIFAVTHWLIGFVWPEQWVPGRRSTRAIVLLSLGYMSLAVLPLVIWAPLKLTVLIGGTLWLMRRGEHDGTPVIEQLAGRVPFRRVLALAPLPIAAATSYGIVASRSLSDDGLMVIYWTLVAVQVIGGAAAYIWAASRSRPKAEWVTPEMRVREPVSK